MKVIKLSQTNHEEIKDIISYIDFDDTLKNKKAIEIILDKNGGIIKEALEFSDVTNAIGNIPNALAQGGQAAYNALTNTQPAQGGTSAVNAVQQGVQQGIAPNEVTNPGSTALQGIQNAQQGAAQQGTQQQSTGVETPNWKPQMRGQGADLLTQTQQGAMIAPVIFEGAIDPQGQQVQVWNTQTNSKQWVPMASVFESGTQRPYPFAGTQAETSPGNMVNPPVQAKQDLQEFYKKLAQEKEAWIGAAVKYAPEIIAALKIIWDAFKEYKGKSENEPIMEEEKAASIKQAFDIKSIISVAPSFITFVTDLIQNEEIRKNIENHLSPETVQRIESIIGMGQQILEFLNKQINPEENSMEPGDINLSTEDYKVSSDLVQVNSETLLIKRGSELYNAIEEKVEKIAKQNNIDGINGVTIDITPKQFKVAYLKDNKVAYRVVTSAEDSGAGGILSTVMNMAKPVYQITKDNPNLTGGAGVIGSIMLAKAQGQDWNLFDNGIVPFLGGKFGGPLTMAAIGGTQATGMKGISKWALILGGFILDNAMKSSMEEDEAKKAELAEKQKNMTEKLSAENPRFMQTVTSYWRQMQQSNPNYTLQQARKDVEETFPESVAAAIYDTIEKIASVKNIQEADSVHISMNEDHAVFRFKNAIGEVQPVQTSEPVMTPETTTETAAPAQDQTQMQPQEQTQEQPLVAPEIADKFKADLEQLNNLVEQNSAAAQDIAGAPTGGEEDVKMAMEGKSEQIKGLADQIMNNPEYKPLIDQMNGQLPKQPTQQVAQPVQQPTQQEQVAQPEVAQQQVAPQGQAQQVPQQQGQQPVA